MKLPPATGSAGEHPEIAAPAGHVVLLAVERARDVATVRRALDNAGIAFDTGLWPDDPPRVLFTVPAELAEGARDAVRSALEPSAAPETREAGTEPLEGSVDRTRPPLAPVRRFDRTSTFGEPSGRLSDDDEYDDETDDARGTDGGDDRPRFPWKRLRWVGAVVGLHVALVVLGIVSRPFRAWVVEDGALAAGGLVLEPWRLLTSLVLHADLRHALSNGVAMIVFAVPLVEWLGARRVAWVYVASGIGGGVTAVALADAGTRFLGSSGAVAGLFGAWVVLAWIRARAADFPGRARIRALGVALLILPSFLTPFTPEGRPISVASHMGGLVTGMLIGAGLSGWFLRIRQWWGPVDRSAP